MEYETEDASGRMVEPSRRQIDDPVRGVSSVAIVGETFSASGALPARPLAAVSAGPMRDRSTGSELVTGG